MDARVPTQDEVSLASMESVVTPYFFGPLKQQFLEKQMSHKRRDDSEQYASGVLVSQHILRAINHSMPPSMSEVARHFDVTRHTIIRWVNLFRDSCDDHPMSDTLGNWLNSHSFTPEVQQNYALLVRDILSSPETWGVHSMEDLSSALHLPMDNLRYYYKKHWVPEWPELPRRERGWVSQETAKAAAQGDVEKIEKLNAFYDDLVAMRHDLIEERLSKFVTQTQ